MSYEMSKKYQKGLDSDGIGNSWRIEILMKYLIKKSSSVIEVTELERTLNCG
jgi:hypothetical protein